MHMLYKSTVSQREGNADNKESRDKMLYKSRVPKKVEKGDNKESRYRCCTYQG